MKLIAIIFEIIFMILAFLLLVCGDYEMSVLACIMSGIVRIENKLEEKKVKGGKNERTSRV